jgi:hypothetical protein
MYVTVPYNKVVFSICIFLTSQSEVDIEISYVYAANNKGHIFFMTTIFSHFLSARLLNAFNLLGQQPTCAVKKLRKVTNDNIFSRTSSVVACHIKPVWTRPDLSHLNTQSVPRSKHSVSL